MADIAVTGESFAEFKAWYQESVRESKKELEEWKQRMEESRKEADRRMAETDRQIKETGKQLKETDRRIGDLGNRFGELAEHLVAPSIKEKFNALGFNFDKYSQNVDIAGAKGEYEAVEIDILLENGDTAIAVEVKAKPLEKYVDRHLERMETLRRRADKHGDKRKFRGAVAGAIMSDVVRNYILKAGLYVVEQSGDTVKINTPEGFKPRDW